MDLCGDLPWTGWAINVNYTRKGTLKVTLLTTPGGGFVHKWGHSFCVLLCDSATLIPSGHLSGGLRAGLRVGPDIDVFSIAFSGFEGRPLLSPLSLLSLLSSLSPFLLCFSCVSLCSTSFFSDPPFSSLLCDPRDLQKTSMCPEE